MYDVEKAKLAEDDITASRMRLSSRHTVSHHKELELVEHEALLKELEKYQPAIPEEGYGKVEGGTRAIPQMTAHEKENVSSNTGGLMPH